MPSFPRTIRTLCASPLYIKAAILTLFLTALEEPSWNLYSARNRFFGCSRTWVTDDSQISKPRAMIDSPSSSSILVDTAKIFVTRRPKKSLAGCGSLA